MATYFIDYEKVVVADYHRRKNKLWLNLSIPKPAKLREACERACRERFLSKDEKVIGDFFGKGGDRKTCLETIRLCKPDKFKPLINYLNGETSKTDEKNIELLAWLIDFPERPFNDKIDYEAIGRAMAANADAELPQTGTDSGLPETGQMPEPIKALPEKKIEEAKNEAEEALRMDVIPSDMTGGNRKDETRLPEVTGGLIAEKDVPGDSDNVAGNTLKEPALANGGNKKVAPRNIALAGLLLFVLGGGAYWWKESMMPMGASFGSGGCMYWKEDHYESVPCNQKIPGVQVIAFDSIKVKNFRKITRPDTITNRAKGYVWYSKINNVLEFYTAAGKHPLAHDRNLRPISDYMINKYIQP